MFVFMVPASGWQLERLTLGEHRPGHARILCANGHHRLPVASSLGQLDGQLNVFRLAGLVAPDQKKQESCTALRVVHPEARTNVERAIGTQHRVMIQSVDEQRLDLRGE